MNKKEFALSQIAPYYKDPSICGYENNICKNITRDGRMCVAGKNMIDPKAFEGKIVDLLMYEGQEIFKPESRNILCYLEWQWLQNVHDRIATKKENLIPENLTYGLFTQKELENYCIRLSY